MAIEKIFICIRKKLRSILMHLKLTGMYGKIMQFSGVIWKYMLCRVGFLWNIYMLIETHVTLFYCTIKYFPYILYFCEQNQFRNLTHFPEYKILFSLVQFFYWDSDAIFRLWLPKIQNCMWIFIFVLRSILKITNYEQYGTEYLLGFIWKVPGCRWDINY